MTTKKVEIRKTRRRLKIKNIMIFIAILVLVINFVICFLELPIKNIYISGNDILTDNEIIELASIDKYPSFVLTTTKNMEKKISSSAYVSSVVVKKKFWGKVYIEVSENYPLCIDISTKEIILSSGERVVDDREFEDIPILINSIEGIHDEFVEKFKLIDRNILLKISQIEYSPVNVDVERFYLAMTDGNYVYVTLTKIKSINKYPSIREEMNGKKGIIYLDSGNYIEIKDDNNEEG